MQVLGRNTAVVRLLREYIRDRESILPLRLISAEELMRRFQLSPGPVVGKLLKDRGGAGEGLIHSKDEAWLAEERLSGMEGIEGV